MIKDSIDAGLSWSVTWEACEQTKPRCPNSQCRWAAPERFAARSSHFRLARPSAASSERRGPQSVSAGSATISLSWQFALEF